MLSRMAVADLIASIPQPEATGPKPAKRRSRYPVAPILATAPNPLQRAILEPECPFKLFLCTFPGANSIKTA